MEEKVSILAVFFENPNATYHIREVAKLTGISHTAVRKRLNESEKEGYLLRKPTKPYKTYQANTASKKYLNLKLFYNLEKIRASGLVEELEHYYNYPVIVLFGSFGKAADDEKSDIDLCVISEVRNIPDIHNFQKIIKRPISMHVFNKQEWKEMKEKNPDLVNSICNGIVLSGQLEVL